MLASDHQDIEVPSFLLHKQSGQNRMALSAALAVYTTLGDALPNLLARLHGENWKCAIPSAHIPTLYYFIIARTEIRQGI